MVDTFTGDIPEYELKKNALKWSIVGELDHNDVKTGDSPEKIKEYENNKRVEEVSLILPQTLFIKKMSTASQE